MCPAPHSDSLELFSHIPIDIIQRYVRVAVVLHGNVIVGHLCPTYVTLGSIFQPLKNEYRIRQIAFNHQLQTSLDNGIENYKEKDFQKAQLNFGEIIKTLTGDEIADLSDKQKLILSKAFTYSAKTLSLGNTNDSKLALTYLEQAVKLMPDYEEAVSMKKSIVAEHNAYRS